MVILKDKNRKSIDITSGLNHLSVPVDQSAGLFCTEPNDLKSGEVRSQRIYLRSRFYLFIFRD